MAGGRSISSNLAPQGNDLSAVASILSDVRGLMGMSASPRGSASASVSATPRKSRPTPATPQHSPVRNTPTLLTRFLRDCEDDFGISGATLYESPLRRKSYGPDILHRVSDSALEGIGIPAGDVIRLKDASLPWYTGPSAKRRRLDTEEPSSEPAVGTISYERRWYDADGKQTGGSRFWGPPMKGGDPHLEEGLQIWYKCPARQDWFPVPRGYEVHDDSVEDDPFGGI